MNAFKVLANELLKDKKKYAAREVLYIPADTQRKKWGSSSGARVYYKQRNEEIRYKYIGLHTGIERLADEYGYQTLP